MHTDTRKEHVTIKCIKTDQTPISTQDNHHDAQKITEKFRTNTGNSMKLSAVTGSPIYLLSLYLFSRTSTITRTLKTVSTLRLLSCLFG